MYLEVEGKKFIIHIKSNIRVIRLNKVEFDVIHLDVPALLSKAELLVYIKNILSLELKKFKNIHEHEQVYINCFDRDFLLQFKNTDYPFISGNVIYNKELSLSILKQEKVKEYLLYNYINTKFSILEEEFNMGLPHIYIRKLKSNLFTINYNLNRINYSKKLVNSSQDYIYFIIVLSLVKYLKMEDDMDRIMNKFVENWKHYHRVFNFEQ